jgi:WD40 repeat protein
VTTLPGHHRFLALVGFRLRTVDVRTGAIHREFTRAGPPFDRCPIFSPSGKTLVTCNPPHVDLWDVETGKIRERLRHRHGDPFNFALSADGKLLAVQNYRLTLWDFTAEPKRIEVNEVMHPGPMAFVGPLLGSTDDPPTSFVLREPTTGEVRFRLEGHTEPITAVAISPDGTVLATGAKDRTVCLWDVPPIRRRAIFRLGTAEISSLAFSPDSSVLAAATGEGGICFWDVQTHEDLAAFRWGNVSTSRIAFAPDGQWLLAVGGGVGKLIPWRALLDAVAGR